MHVVKTSIQFIFSSSSVSMIGWCSCTERFTPRCAQLLSTALGILRSKSRRHTTLYGHPRAIKTQPFQLVFQRTTCWHRSLPFRLRIKYTEEADRYDYWYPNLQSILQIWPIMCVFLNISTLEVQPALPKWWGHSWNTSDISNTWNLINQRGLPNNSIGLSLHHSPATLWK